MNESINKTIIQQLIERNVQTAHDFGLVQRDVLRGHAHVQPDHAELLETYRTMVATQEIQPHKTIEKLLGRAEIRSLSGVSILTVLTKPYPCPGKCVYCPTESIMPKSYLSNEPAAARALRNAFDPYTQIWNRMEQLHRNGHEVQKVELIVKGGTWNAYRYDYQLWFIRRCFDACNEFKPGAQPIPEDDALTISVDVDPATTFTNTSHMDVTDAPIAKTAESISARIAIEEKKLKTAQDTNESTTCRIIGLTLETRPDWIRVEEVARLRTLGCTRVEVGLQQTDDAILKLIKRGHTLKQFEDGIKLLRDAGFKVDFHTMPQLPGSTPEKDDAMFNLLWSKPTLRPDMIKIYPCSVVPLSELHEWWKRGEFTPYDEKALFEMIIRAKTNVPKYCRISRLIRDIPSDSIEAGNKVTNLREYLQKEMERRGLQCVCLRCREYGRQIKIHPELATTEPQLFIEEYEASEGTELFLTFEDANRHAVYAFLRLRLSGSHQNERLTTLMPEIKNAAFIRELHSYGHVTPISTTGDETTAQHKGLGRRLVEAAESLAHERGYASMLVISGIGVRAYYASLGYTIVGTYMGKNL